MLQSQSFGGTRFCDTFQTTPGCPNGEKCSYTHVKIRELKDASIVPGLHVSPLQPGTTTEAVFAAMQQFGGKFYVFLKGSYAFVNYYSWDEAQPALDTGIAHCNGFPVKVTISSAVKNRASALLKSGSGTHQNSDDSKDKRNAADSGVILATSTAQYNPVSNDNDQGWQQRQYGRSNITMQELETTQDQVEQSERELARLKTLYDNLSAKSRKSVDSSSQTIVTAALFSELELHQTDLQNRVEEEKEKADSNELLVAIEKADLETLMKEFSTCQAAHNSTKNELNSLKFKKHTLQDGIKTKKDVADQMAVRQRRVAEEISGLEKLKKDLEEELMELVPNVQLKVQLDKASTPYQAPTADNKKKRRRRKKKKIDSSNGKVVGPQATPSDNSSPVGRPAKIPRNSAPIQRTPPETPNHRDSKSSTVFQSTYSSGKGAQKDTTEGIVDKTVGKTTGETNEDTGEDTAEEMPKEKQDNVTEQKNNQTQTQGNRYLKRKRNRKGLPTTKKSRMQSNETPMLHKRMNTNTPSNARVNDTKSRFVTYRVVPAGATPVLVHPSPPNPPPRYLRPHFHHQELAHGRGGSRWNLR